MAQPAGSAREGRRPRDAAAADSDQSASRSSNRLMFAMVACCAAIPLALLVIAIAGGATLGGVSPWAWGVLVVAFAAAMVVAARTMLRGEAD